MGFLKKAFKKVGKAVGNVWKGAKKVFKKVVSSKIFKYVLIAVAIYFGGVALGAWGGAAPAAGTVAVSGGTTAVGAGTGVTAVAPVAVAETGAVASGASAVGGAAPVVSAAPGYTVPAVTQGGTTASMVAPSAVQAGGMQVVQKAGQEVATSGILNTLMGGAKSAIGWVGENPYPAAIMTAGLGAALSPNAEDLQKNKWDREDDERRRQSRNMNIAGIDLGVRQNRQDVSVDARSGTLNSRMSGEA